MGNMSGFFKQVPFFNSSRTKRRKRKRPRRKKPSLRQRKIRLARMRQLGLTFVALMLVFVAYVAYLDHNAEETTLDRFFVQRLATLVNVLRADEADPAPGKVGGFNA